MSENLIASFHMDDDALIWFQDASEAGVFCTCEGFGQVVQNQFGSSLYDDPMKSWTKLKQVGAVTSYKTEFEVLFNRNGVISEKDELSCFLGVLRDEILLHVRMLKPSNLNDAFGLAKIQEQYVWSIKRQWRNGSFECSQQRPGMNSSKSGQNLPF